MTVVSSDFDPASAVAAPAAVSPTEAFQRLYREHFRFVWRMARSLGVPERRLEDAVQDVFIVALRRIDERREAGSARAWLFEITRRIPHDYRRSMRRKDGAEPLPEGLADAGAPGPARQAEATEELRLVEAILANLDEDRRVIFILAEIEQMTSPEIAETLGINLNTVYSRLRRAREEFHAAFTRARGVEP